MKKEFEKIKKLLIKGKTAIIAAHEDPDGDAVGSMLALGMALEKKGLEVFLYCADRIPKIYTFLPNTENIKHELEPFKHFDLFFVVDSSDLSRIGNKVEPRKIAKTLINIDHHPDNTLFADINYAVKSSSAAEEIFDLCHYLKIKVDKKIADCLYTAIITDTGNFRYENTTVKTFQIAAELLKAGVNTHELTTLIYDRKSIPSIRISAKALAGIRFSTGRSIGWTSVTEEMMRETQAEGEDLIGIIDKIRSIEGVELALFFREKNGEIKINFRSKDKINVSDLAAKFGGGGHTKAAGAVIKGNLDVVVEKVIAEANKLFAFSAA